MSDKEGVAMVTIVMTQGREKIFVQNQLAKDLAGGEGTMTRETMEKAQADGIEFELIPVARQV